MHTKISIITAVYNGGKTLPQAIESVLSQTYPFIEYIIIDGNSTDHTQSIIRSYEGRISRWISEPDQGIYDAMNKGLKMATGDIIGILNSDDFYQNDRVIERIVAVFDKEKPDALYGDLMYVDAENTNKVVRYWKANSYRPNSFLLGWMPPHPTFFVRRELYARYGLFNPQFRCSADYELMLRLIHKNKIRLAYLPELIVNMRTGGVSNQSVQSRLLANREDCLAWKLNNLRPAFYTLWLKPFRKLFQYLAKPAIKNNEHQNWCKERVLVAKEE
jgi:glycosyltransferase involved in cell wall biosynthesis